MTPYFQTGIFGERRVTNQGFTDENGNAMVRCWDSKGMYVVPDSAGKKPEAKEQCWSKEESLQEKVERYAREESLQFSQDAV